MGCNDNCLMGGLEQGLVANYFFKRDFSKAGTMTTSQEPFHRNIQNAEPSSLVELSLSGYKSVKFYSEVPLKSIWQNWD